MLQLRYDPVHGRDFTYFPESDNYYRSHGPYTLYDWPLRYRVWFPYRHFHRHLDYIPSRYLTKYFRVSLTKRLDFCFKIYLLIMSFQLRDQLYYNWRIRWRRNVIYIFLILFHFNKEACLYLTCIFNFKSECTGRSWRHEWSLGGPTVSIVLSVTRQILVIKRCFWGYIFEFLMVW